MMPANNLSTQIDLERAMRNTVAQWIRNAIRWAHTRVAIGFLLLFAASQAFAQSSSVETVGMIPPGSAPGTPASATMVGDMESVSVQNGNLNVTVPLLSIAGRGGAGYTVMLRIKKTPWTVENFMNGFSCGEEGGPPCFFWVAKARSEWWTPVATGYDPGLVQGQYMSSEIETCVVGGTSQAPSYGRTFTALSFTAPDGTEHYLYDEVTGGSPIDWLCSTPDYNRGRVFSAKDGSGITFIADNDIVDDVTPNNAPRGGLFWPSGYLKTRDGSVFRYVSGRAEWMRDRNGNRITFEYDNYSPIDFPTVAHRRVTKITDPLLREVNINYDVQDSQYGTHDQIIYKGFDGLDRVVRVSKTSLSNAFRPNSGYQVKTLSGLFPQLPSSGSSPFNPTVVSGVWLADGLQHFRFYYNEYNELARMEWPIGGAVEYDYWAGRADAYASGQIGEAITFGEPRIGIYRRLKERRLYPQGGNTASVKTLYSREVTAIDTQPYVIVDNVDPQDSNRLLSREKQTFCSNTFIVMTGAVGVSDGVVDPLGGKQCKSEILSNDGNNTVLKRVEYVWDQGQFEGARTTLPWSPYLKETITSLLVDAQSGQYQVAKKTAINPQTGEVGYDTYNNQTDVWDYEFGLGAPGNLTRHYKTAYFSSINGTDYTTTDVHLRHLPASEELFDANGIRRAKTTYEYDNYNQNSGDAFHHALVPRTDITGLDSTITSSVYTRGNLTRVTRHLLNSAGSDLTSINRHLQYDVAGNMVVEIYPLSTASDIISAQFDFDDRFGVADNEARSNSSSPLSLLNTYAFLTKATDALGHSTYTQRNYHSGLVVNTEDVNGVVSSQEYGNAGLDLLDRPSRSVEGANLSGELAQHKRQSKTIYSDSNHLIVVTSDLNNFDDDLQKTETIYDGLGRTVESRDYETSSTFIVSKSEFDALGRVSRIYNACRSTSDDTYGWKNFAYDALSRPVRVETFDGQANSTGVEQYSYRASMTLSTDQKGNQRLSKMNSSGQITDVWEITTADEATSSVAFGELTLTGYRTQYEYAISGDVSKVTQGNQTSRHFEYDALGRLTDSTTPEAGHISYNYDANGNLLSRVDARQIVTTMLYDRLDRLTSTTYSDGTPTISRTYDSSTYGVGRLATINSSVSSISYSAYDPMGRVQTTNTSMAIPNGQPQSFIQHYEYDKANSIISETYPSGRVVKTEYDAAGRITGVKDGATNHYYAGAAPVSGDRIQYSATGGVQAMRLGNGLWETGRYNSRAQLTQIGLGNTSSTTETLKIEYRYGTLINNVLDQASNNGDMQSQTISQSGVSVITQNYEYDRLNRIKRAEELGASGWIQQFTYDRFGNRTSITNTDHPNFRLPSVAPEVDPQTNRYKTVTGQSVATGFSYDASGNLLTEPDGAMPLKKYTYDAENRVVEVKRQGSPDTIIASYAYDGNGKRVRKIVGTQLATYVFNIEDQVVAEYGDTSGPGGTRYITQDVLGSTRVVTDAGASVKERHDYLAFGEEIPSGYSGRSNSTPYGVNGERHKFTQKQRDDESGLDYFFARYYSSPQGRFTSPDSFMGNPASQFVGGAKSSALPFSLLSDPQSLNLYAYVTNRPLALVDRDGHSGDEKPVPGSPGYTYRADISNTNDSPNLHIFNRKGTEIGRVAIKGDIENPRLEWEPGQQPPKRVMANVERLIKEQLAKGKWLPRPAPQAKVEAVEVAPKPNKSAGRNSGRQRGRGGSRGGGSFGVMGALTILQALLEVITITADSANLGYFVDMRGVIIITDFQLAVQNLPTDATYIFQGHVFVFTKSRKFIGGTTCQGCTIIQDAEGKVRIKYPEV